MTARDRRAGTPLVRWALGPHAASLHGHLLRPTDQGLRMTGHRAMREGHVFPPCPYLSFRPKMALVMN